MMQPPAYVCEGFMYGPAVPARSPGQPVGRVDTLRPLIGQPKNVYVAAARQQFPKQYVFVEVAGRCRGFTYRWPGDSVWHAVHYMPGGACGGVEFDLSTVAAWDTRRVVPLKDRNVLVRYLWLTPPKHFWTPATMPCAFQ